MTKLRGLEINIGDKFGRLVVIKNIRKSNGRSAFLCRCDCGEKQVAMRSQLTHGRIVSCGCAKSERAARMGYEKNLHRHEPTYNSWKGMLKRCYYKKSISYHNYGGRGIRVCRRWRESYDNLLEDMGKRPKGKTLDRINNDGHYKLSNCRWASKSEQVNNTCLNRPITFRGVTKNLNQWAEETGISRYTIAYRLNSGKSIRYALTKEVRKFK